MNATIQHITHASMKVRVTTLKALRLEAARRSKVTGKFWSMDRVICDLLKTGKRFERGNEQ